MNDHGWRKIVRVGIACLIIIFMIRIGGEFILALLGGEIADKSIGEVIGDSITGALNWFGDILNYAIFGN